MNGILLSLNRLVLHGNKLPKPQNWEGFVEFLSNTQHNIRDVNISGTNIPPANLADILSIKDGSFAIEASYNNLCVFFSQSPRGKFFPGIIFCSFSVFVFFFLPLNLSPGALW
jgi:hypothetical protein